MRKDCWSKTGKLMHTKDLVGSGGEKNGKGKKKRGKGQRSALRFRGKRGTVFLSFRCFQNFSEKLCQLPVETSEEEILEERH